MANYSKLDGYVFDKQSNVGWGLTLKMSGKAPAVAKRIFDTYEHALAYANDVNDSAIEGLVLSVVADTDAALNGVYFVQQAAAPAVEADEEKGIEAVDAKSAILVKLGSEAGANGDLLAALQALDVTDTAVAGEFVSEVSQTDGKISVKRASLADAKVDVDAEGNAVSLKAKLAALNQSVVDEKNAREQAFKDIKGELVEGDAATLEAVNAELNALDGDIQTINDTIGTVAEGKTVVEMIEDAQAAAEAAATKIAAKTEGHVTVAVAEDETTGALTYTISESDIASAEGLQDEIDRAVEAEAGLQSQIGKAATETDGPTGLHKAIADVKDAYEAAIEAMDATKTGEGTFVDVTVEQVNGVITNVVVAESDIASAQALADETKARTDADDDIMGRLDVIEGEAAGSIKKAVADAKAELLGEVADTDAKTLAALNDRIDSVVTDAKTYSIAKATTEEVASLGTNVKEAYKLVDEDNVKVGEFIPVYKDSALQKVELVGQELQFTYLLTDGETDTVGVDVSTFLAESEFKNGLSVNENGEVSVKVDAASEAFLTVGADGVKLAGVQEAINAAKKDVTDRLDVIEGADTVEGSVKKALKDAKDYTDTKIAGLDAEVTSTDGSHVTVKVTEVDGVITAVNVTESDIASAQGLADEIGRATSAETALANRLTVIEGEDVGSIKKAVADAKAALLGDAAEDYNTLGKLEDKVIAAEAAAKAAATKIAAKTEGHVTVAVAEDETTGALTYTISESDIASATGLTAETKAREDADAALDGRLDVLEGVTVTGKDAIVVSETEATKNKEVSLKLGTQPSENEAGIVLSQDANGLVAKLQWGTF